MLLKQALIREAVQEDGRGIIATIHSVLEESDNNLITSTDDINIIPDQETNFINTINANSNSLILVAESITVGQIVGLLVCQGEEHNSKRHTTRMDIMVMKEWRGQGIGTRLIKEALRWAEKHPTIRRIEIEVLARNTGAMALCSRLGFRVEGCAIGGVRKDDHYLDYYWMAVNVTKSTSRTTRSTETVSVIPTAITRTTTTTSPVLPETKPEPEPEKDKEPKPVTQPDPALEETQTQPTSVEPAESTEKDKPADKPAPALDASLPAVDADETRPSTHIQTGSLNHREDKSSTQQEED